MVNQYEITNRFISKCSCVARLFALD